MNLRETNKTFRKSIIQGFFEPGLLNLDFKRSSVRHPVIREDGLMQSSILHIFFDLETGLDYPDGDEWFITEFLFPSSIQIPDRLKGADYFTTLATSDDRSSHLYVWRHRELVRYKHGKSKKLDESLKFLDAKYKELYSMLEPLEKSNSLEL